MRTTLHITEADHRKLSDEELLRRYTDLHEYTAYNALYNRYAHLVLGMCLPHVVDTAAARHRTEDIFLQVLNDIKAARSPRFKTWLFGYVNKYNVGKRLTDDRAPATGEAAQDIFAHLPSQERSCVRLFYEGNKSYAAIAAETGLPVGKVKELLHDAAEHLNASDHSYSNTRTMPGDIAHIFDDSNCISRKQAFNYISGDMDAEESHAVEHHLNNCTLCSTAVEGLQSNVEGACIELPQLELRFLNDHFSVLYPQIHLNSFAHAGRPAKKRKMVHIPVWVNIIVATVVAMALILLLYMEQQKRPSFRARTAQGHSIFFDHRS